MQNKAQFTKAFWPRLLYLFLVALSLLGCQAPKPPQGPAEKITRPKEVVERQLIEALLTTRDRDLIAHLTQEADDLGLIDNHIAGLLLEKCSSLADERLVLPLLHSPEAKVKIKAIYLLRQMEAEPAIPLIANLLEPEEDSEVRIAAAVALRRFNDARALDGLLTALGDPLPEVRYNAVYALGRLKEPAATPSLLKALKDEEPGVRAEAAFALGRIRAQEALQPLIQASKDPKSNVRQKAAIALGLLRNKKAIPALEALLEDADKEIRYYARSALVRLQPEKAEEILLQGLREGGEIARRTINLALREPPQVAFRVLQTALHYDDSRVRLYALSRFSRIPGVRFTSEVARALEDEDKEIRRNALETIRSLQDSMAQTALEKLILQEEDKNLLRDAIEVLRRVCGPKAVPFLRERLLHDPRPLVRSTSAEELRSLPKDGETLFAFRQALRDPYSPLRKSAIPYLAASKSPEALNDLGLGLSDTDQSVRDEALRCLAELGNEEAIETLIQMLESDEPARRKWAATSLCYPPTAWGLLAVARAFFQGRLDLSYSLFRRRLSRLKDKNLIPPFSRELASADVERARAAAFLLAYLEDKKTKRALKKALRHKDARVRFEAACGLAFLGEKAPLEPILEVANQGSGKERLQAIDALGKVPDKRALVILTLALKDKDPEISRAAARALGQFPAPGATEPLIRALDDPDKDLRRQATYALLQRGTPKAAPRLVKSLGEDPDYSVKRAARRALIAIGDASVIPDLIDIIAAAGEEATKDEEYAAREAFIALKNIAGENFGLTRLPSPHWSRIRKNRLWLIRQYHLWYEANKEILKAKLVRINFFPGSLYQDSKYRILPEKGTSFWAKRNNGEIIKFIYRFPIPKKARLVRLMAFMRGGWEVRLDGELWGTNETRSGREPVIVPIDPEYYQKDGRVEIEIGDRGRAKGLRMHIREEFLLRYYRPSK